MYEAKCIFGVSMLQFISHEISNAGITLLSCKVAAMQKFPLSTTLRKVREFLGIVDLHRRSMPSCAVIARPLTDILAQRTEYKDIDLNDTQIQAFKPLMSALANATMLTNPCHRTELSLVTDACDYTLGDVLQQPLKDIWISLSFFSKKTAANRTTIQCIWTRIA